jgi:hypothetical protein
MHALSRDFELPARLPDSSQADHVQALPVAPRSHGAREDDRAAVRTPEERAVRGSGGAGNGEHHRDAEESTHTPILGSGSAFPPGGPWSTAGRKDPACANRREAPNDDSLTLPFWPLGRSVFRTAGAGDCPSRTARSAVLACQSPSKHRSIPPQAQSVGAARSMLAAVDFHRPGYQLTEDVEVDVGEALDVEAALARLVRPESFE